MDSYHIFLAFAVGPFLLIQCMPGKKTFTLLSALYAALIYFAYYDVQYADGPDSEFAVATFYLFCYSAFSGILTRACTLFMASRGMSQKHRSFAQVLGFLLIPAMLFASGETYQMKQRTPSDSCKYDVITFALEDKNFRVPSIEIVVADNGDGNDGDGNLTHYFRFVSSANFRKFCDQFDNGQSPAKVNAVVIRFFLLNSASRKPNFISRCVKAQWPREICEAPVSLPLISYPLEILIYNKAKFSAGRFGGGWDYQRIKDEIQKAESLSDIPNFTFDGRYYYWVDSSSTNEQKEDPFALKCIKSSKELACQADEKWANDVHVSYTGNVSLEAPIEDARKLRQTTLDFLKHIQVTK